MTLNSSDVILSTMLNLCSVTPTVISSGICHRKVACDATV